MNVPRIQSEAHCRALRFYACGVKSPIDRSKGLSKQLKRAVDLLGRRNRLQPHQEPIEHGCSFHDRIGNELIDLDAALVQNSGNVSRVDLDKGLMEF